MLPPSPWVHLLLDDLTQRGRRRIERDRARRPTAPSSSAAPSAGISGEGPPVAASVGCVDGEAVPDAVGVGVPGSQEPRWVSLPVSVVRQTLMPVRLLRIAIAGWGELGSVAQVKGSSRRFWSE